MTDTAPRIGSRWVRWIAVWTSASGLWGITQAAVADMWRKPRNNPRLNRLPGRVLAMPVENPARPAMADYEKRLSDDEFDRLYSDDYYRRFEGADRGYTVSRFVNPLHKWARRERAMLDLAQLDGEEVVIEAGSAAGSLSLILARHARQVIGVDLAPVAVELARERARRLQVANVEFVVGSIADLSFAESGSIDRVVGFDIVEHVYNDVLRGFFRESARVLKTGGALCIYTPNLNHYVERMKQRNFPIRQAPDHIAVRNWAMIAEQLAASGASLQVESLYYIESPYPIVRHADRVLMKVPRLGALFQWRICARLVKV